MVSTPIRVTPTSLAFTFVPAWFGCSASYDYALTRW
jgi:hypothetical protein